MNYYIIWYEDYINGKLIDKDKAQEIANTLISNTRTVEVEPHIMR